MSQTPEIHLSSAALTFGWALLKPQPLPSKPSAGGTLRSLLCPHSGTPATLPRLSAVVQPCPWQGIHWKPIHGPSPSSLLRVPGAGQVTRELTQPVLLPHPCIPHHRRLPRACRASSLGQKRHFFFLQSGVFAAERVLLWYLQKVVKEWTAGNLIWNSNANTNNTNKKKTSTFSQMPALNDSGKEIYIFIWV